MEVVFYLVQQKIEKFGSRLDLALPANNFGLLIVLSLSAVSVLSRVGGWLGGWGGSENTDNSAQLELELGLSLAI